MHDYVCEHAPNSPNPCTVSELSLEALELVIGSTDYQLQPCVESEGLTCDALRERCRIELLIRSLGL